MSVHFKLTHMPVTKTADNPLDEQREIYELLSQETRHLILQNILGHPEHLPSLDELDHMIPKNKASIADQLDTLEEAEIIKEYTYEPNESSRDLPSNFYGLTPEGLEILNEHNYLRGLDFARTVYENTRKTEKIERHQDAPRAELPPEVASALSGSISESPSEDSRKISEMTRHIMTENENKRSLEDQVAVAKLLYEEGITSDNTGIKRSELENLVSENNLDLDFQLATSLENLREIDVVERNKPPGPDTYVIGERIDEIINGQVVEYAEQEIESLIRHMDDEIERTQAFEITRDSAEGGPTVAITDGAGDTIRTILAEKFRVPSEEVEEYLREGDKISRLNDAVQAIKQHDNITKGEDYGEIIFLSQPYRYRLTESYS